jgi:hypothetical protein
MYKLRLINLLWKILLFFSLIYFYSWGDDYELSNLSSGEKNIPQQGNKYINSPDNNTPLLEIDSIPDSLSSGELILRRRFSSEEYSLYQGQISEYACSKDSGSMFLIILKGSHYLMWQC